jgi:hypothetical protein
LAAYSETEAGSLRTSDGSALAIKVSYKLLKEALPPASGTSYFEPDDVCF